MCYSRPTVYAHVPNFVSIGLFCRLLLVKTPILSFFWITGFSVVASWKQSDKVGHECTTTNLPLSNGIKIVSVLQRTHGEIGRTISDVQKRDGQANRQRNRQTDKQTKNSMFLAAPRRLKSEPHQTCHGDRGPRVRSARLKILGDVTHSFSARGR